MPLFEYQCRDCGRTFEAFVTAERSAGCPGCEGSNLIKLLSSPGMVGSTSSATRSVEPFTGCGAGGNACACRTSAADGN